MNLDLEMVTVWLSFIAISFAVAFTYIAANAAKRSVDK